MEELLALALNQNLSMTSIFLDGLWMWMEQQMFNLEEYKKSYIKLAYDEMATLEAEINPTGNILIHLTVHNNIWTKAKYKEWKADWEIIKLKLKAKGYNEMFALILHDQYKSHKFVKMFGFNEMLVFQDAILYRQEI